MSTTLRIGSRPSKLALIQAGMVCDAIVAALPSLKCEIIAIKTSGDKNLTPSLADIGGKGLFIKELEQALIQRRINVAVHSMKDLPAVLERTFRIAATPRRENPHDALVTRDGAAIKSLRKGARLGTSSPRRRFEALRINPALEVVPLRGNVDTRLAKVASGELDAIILAMAGLKRLGKTADINFQELDEREFVPAAAQAALAVEALADTTICGSDEVETAVAAINDSTTALETAAERAFLAAIHASCTTPVGVKATLANRALALRALLFSGDGSREMTDEIAEPAGDVQSAIAIGERLGARMLTRGARDLLGDG
jgi:hydroxymethylbilane synthase